LVSDSRKPTVLFAADLGFQLANADLYTPVG
jgi:hypothetical protein